MKKRLDLSVRTTGMTAVMTMAAAAITMVAAPMNAVASSHMDAPAITLDDAANTTDVYAFLSEDSKGNKYLTTAVAVYPFEEPGIGPNAYRFDDNVKYAIHVALDGNVSAGEPDLTYEFEFKTRFANNRTILQSFLGPLASPSKGAFPDNQNLRQTYRVTKIDNRTRRRTILGNGERDGLIVPANNQGLVTAQYNQGNDGDRPAKGGVSAKSALDPFTRSAIATLKKDYVAFAGQRDDGFYADIQSIFDLDFTFGSGSGTPTKPFDSQGGFNVHTIVLNIPIEELSAAKKPGKRARGKTKPAQLAGVYATTSRSKFGPGKGRFNQVGRQGNPLFVEALLAIRDKDRYNESNPNRDFRFRDAAENPQLSQLLGATPVIPGLLKSIYIPDVIKVDLTTPPARLAGQSGFNRLSVFGGDVLKSEFQDPFGNGGFVPGGWPNGRRFGDDVVDIAVIALGIAGPGPDFSGVNIDRVDANDITFNQVFPYAATPLNGRVHGHHGNGGVQ